MTPSRNRSPFSAAWQKTGPKMPKKTGSHSRVDKLAGGSFNLGPGPASLFWLVDIVWITSSALAQGFRCFLVTSAQVIRTPFAPHLGEVCG